MNDRRIIMEDIEITCQGKYVKLKVRAEHMNLTYHPVA
jgi:hypothetical protein